MSGVGEGTPSPRFDRRTEVEALLADDPTLLGRYWGYVQSGLSREETADREGLDTYGWTSNYAFLLEMLLEGRLTSKPLAARGSASRPRTWLKSKPLSDGLRAELAKQERILAAVAEDREAQETAEAEAQRPTEEAESANVPGIYVYTLPHYLLQPYEPESGRTLLKVGHSSVDAIHRAGSQCRLTALPEDPILLRIYPTEHSADVERRFHGWLEDAEH